MLHSLQDPVKLHIDTSIPNPKFFSRMNHNSFVNKKWKLLMERYPLGSIGKLSGGKLLRALCWTQRRNMRENWCQGSCYEMNGFWGNALREEGVIKTLFRLLYEIAGELATAGGEQLSNQSSVEPVLAIKLFNWSSIGCAASIWAYQVFSCNQRENRIPN